MEINDTNRENIRSALKALERKVLNRAGGCFSGEDAESFIEAVVFLKERGYPLVAGRDSGSDALKTYESLPEEDREVLDGLGYPSNLGKLLDGGVAEAVIKLFGKSPLFQEGYRAETPSLGDLFSEVVSCYETRRMHAGTIRQGDNIAAIMQDLLLKGIKSGPDGRISVYDMAMGTGLMLSAVAEKAGEMCPKAHVVCCGQEIGDKLGKERKRGDRRVQGDTVRKVPAGPPFCQRRAGPVPAKRDIKNGGWRKDGHRHDP